MGDGRLALEDGPGAVGPELEARKLEGQPGDPVPDAVAPPPHHPRFPLIDGMRAIAVMSVVLIHTTAEARDVDIVGPLLAHTNIGVTIFFLISGFLLYRPFIAHRGGGAAAPSVVQYAKRRLLRIYPAYWLVLTVLVIVPGLTGVGNGDWWAQYGLVYYLPLPGGATGCTGLLSDCGLFQTWSLVVEMTFYAALPLYVLATAYLARGRSVRSWVRLELLLLAALSLVSVLLHFVVADDTATSWLTRSVIGYVFWFALGMGLAVCSVGLEHRERQLPMIRLIASRPLVPWALAFAAYALLSAWLPANPVLPSNRLIVVHLTFGVIAALLLLPAVFGDQAGGLPRQFLANPVVAWLGLISYGIFLWHYVIARELVTSGLHPGAALLLIGTLAITIPIAAGSYYLVERPLLRLKYRRLRDVIAQANRLRGPSSSAQRAR